MRRRKKKHTTHNNGVDSIRRNSEGENDEIPNVTIVNAPLEYRSRVWTFFGFKAVDGITMKNTFIYRTCHRELSYNQTKQYDCSHETKARGRSEFLWVLTVIRVKWERGMSAPSMSNSTQTQKLRKK